MFAKKNQDKELFSLFSFFSFKTKIYFLFTLILTFFTIIVDLIIKINKYGYTLKVIKNFFKFFTNHTILSILLILISFFFKIKNKKKHSFFCFLVLVNALLTFFVFNLFLSKYNSANDKPYVMHPIIKIFNREELKFNIINSLQHVFIPLFYFILFFFFIPFSLKGYKIILLTYINPFLYLLTFALYLFFIGNVDCCSSSKCCWLPYPNIQCNIHGEVIFGSGTFFVFVRIMILSFLFGIFFFLIFLLKNKFNKKIIMIKN
ncbi:MAG: hypothetical protein Q2306_00015 [Phytoplasma sp.]|uniref:hypothetical protein n=1 Tax=Phytoplasma sp. TaxID=2155 RepID=UPI002B40EBEE|nr:hypothetical protein [Phytoplasma sp.]WRH06740.1 MAG: hypothetical protein Q2306_00015 [Phytoplasma sp.]